MKVWKRTRPIRLVVIHVNVGPEIPVTSAESLGRYLDSIVGGYHHVHDDDSTLTLARDDQCVAGAKGGDCNEVAVHHCIIGRADQTAQQWADAFSKAAVGRCAKSVASYCLAYGIAADHIVGSGIRLPAKSGICGHGDVSAAWNVKGGHTDPGPQFPWVQFLDLVRAYMTDAPVLPLPAPPSLLKGRPTMLEQPLRPGEGPRDPTRPQVARIEPADPGLIWLHNGASVAGDAAFGPSLRYLRVPTTADNPLVDLIPEDGAYGLAGFIAVSAKGHGHFRVWS